MPSSGLEASALACLPHSLQPNVVWVVSWGDIRGLLAPSQTPQQGGSSASADPVPLLGLTTVKCLPLCILLIN